MEFLLLLGRTNSKGCRKAAPASEHSPGLLAPTVPISSQLPPSALLPSTTKKSRLVTLETGAHWEGVLGSSWVWRLSHSTSSSSEASLWFFHLASFWEFHGAIIATGIFFIIFSGFFKSVILSLTNSLVQKSRVAFQHSTNRSRSRNQGHDTRSQQRIPSADKLEGALSGKMALVLI